MRPLTEEETKTFYKKLAKFIGYLCFLLTFSE